MFMLMSQKCSPAHKILNARLACDVGVEKGRGLGGSEKERGLSHFSPPPPFAPTTLAYADLHYYPPLLPLSIPTSSLFFLLTFLFTEEFKPSLLSDLSYYRPLESKTRTTTRTRFDLTFFSRILKKRTSRKASSYFFSLEK